MGARQRRGVVRVVNDRKRQRVVSTGMAQPHSRVRQAASAATDLMTQIPVQISVLKNHLDRMCQSGAKSCWVAQGFWHDFPGQQAMRLDTIPLAFQH